MRRNSKSLAVGAGVIAAVALGLHSTGAASADFPSKEIQVISHASPGGGTDTTARMMMIRSRRILAKGIKAFKNSGAPMNVVYKRGGAGKRAHEYLLKRPADGHTLLALTQTHFYTIARGKTPLKAEDLIGVARAMDDPTFIVVRKDSPFKTIDDMIAASKTKALNWGVSQIGGTEHIGLARFAKEAGIKFKVVPFGSGGKMVAALLSGSIDATLPNVSEAVDQIANKTVRPLLVLAPKRLNDYPDVVSSFEKGWKVAVSTTRGYAVRKGTPPEIVDKLSKSLVKAMQHSTFGGYLRASGLDPKTSPAGTEVWTKQIQEEIAIAKKALKELGMIK
ncbi:MAG: tripartite tricarboxylate transporter substrate binding protein [Alphaproteobacteria bacterium]|nr:tripartite tricarboxylate transporter substrate binding protein [Alphaproteobacteria bacterium]